MKDLIIALIIANIPFLIMIFPMMRAEYNCAKETNNCNNCNRIGCVGRYYNKIRGEKK